MADKANKYFFELLNELISESIKHGGDTGGPYYINEAGVARAMFRLINFLGLKDEVGVLNDDGGEFRYYLLRHVQKETEGKGKGNG